MWCFFFKVDDQCIKVTRIQNLDKYVAQCYGKDRMINIFYNELNRFSFQHFINKTNLHVHILLMHLIKITNYHCSQYPYLYRWHPSVSDHAVCQFNLTALHPMLLVLNIKSNMYITLIIV